MKYQRGELSLFWAAVFIGVLTLAAVMALLSMRYERNLFGESWKRITGSDMTHNLQADVREKTVAATRAPIRKCRIAGKVVYSNVECPAADPTSRQVELNDTRGIEAPKAPAASAPADAPATLQERMVERAVQR